MLQRLPLQVDESFTGDIENHFFDGGSGELPEPYVRESWVTGRHLLAVVRPEN
jgi:hypothetical protein